MLQSPTCRCQEHPAWLCLPLISTLLLSAAFEALAPDHHSLTHRPTLAPSMTCEAKCAALNSPHRSFSYAASVLRLSRPSSSAA